MDDSKKSPILRLGDFFVKIRLRILFFAVPLLCLHAPFALCAADTGAALQALSVSGKFVYTPAPPPPRGSPKDREVNGYLRSFPDCWIKPYHADAVAFFDMHPGDYFRRLEFLPGQGESCTLVRVFIPESQRGPLAANPIKTDSNYATQTLSLPPGMADRILAAMKREVASAKPGGQKGNCRTQTDKNGYTYHGMLDGSSSIYFFAVRTPDGAYKLAETALPQAYNPAHLAAIFNALKSLPLLPPKSEEVFLQIEALLTLLESGQNAP